MIDLNLIEDLTRSDDYYFLKNVIKTSSFQNFIND